MGSTEQKLKRMENAAFVGVGIWGKHEGDTTHDVSVVHSKTGDKKRIGTFHHASTAEFVETLVNAYQNGEIKFIQNPDAS